MWYQLFLYDIKYSYPVLIIRGAHGVTIIIVGNWLDDPGVAYREEQQFLMNRNIVKSKVDDLCRGWPKGSLLNSYYTEV